MSHLQNTSPDQEQAGASQAKKRTLGYFHGEAAAAATGDAADGYQAPSMVAAGASGESVALLVALTRLPVAYLYSRIPWMMRKAGSRKNGLLAIAAIDALTWLPLIAVLIFLRPVSPFWLIICWMVNLIPGTLVLPVRDGWLADAIPGKTMGRYLGLRTIISAALYLGMFYVMGYLLDIFADQVFLGFAVVFWMAFSASLFKTVLFSRMKDNSDPTKRYVRFGLSDFIEETKKGSLGRFIVYISMLNFAVYLSAPFFAVYMVTELHFSYTTFAVIFSADFIARALSASYWGKYTDRIGALPLMERISYLIPIIPVLWLVSSNVIYLVGIQLFSGIIWAGFEVCSQSLIYKTASPEKRGGYIIYQRGLTMLGQAFGALVGAAIFGFMIPLFGSKILGLFLLSGILRLVVARIILPGMTEDRAPVQTRHGPTRTPGIYSRPEYWPAYVKDFASRHTIQPAAPKPRPAHGLYHVQPGLVSQVERKVEPKAVPAFGLYHVRHEQGCFAGCRASAIDSKPVPPVVARGLLHNPEKWAAYRGQLTKKILAPETVAAHGLFHQPEKWVAYRRQSAKQNEAVPASGLFHNPRQWAEHVRSTPIAPARKLEKIDTPIRVKTARLPGKLVPALAYA